MTEIQFRSVMDVELVDWMGDDYSIVQSARVSTGMDTKPFTDLDIGPKEKGLINFLMRDRHGTPFEHITFTFRVSCPIFVSREVFRHRMASYNEISGRYVEMEPVFYVPDNKRPLRQIGKPGAYTFESGNYDQTVATAGVHKRVATEAWTSYQSLLQLGVAREVARNVLPLSLYTSFYMTVNARSLMNFLSLRWAHPLNKVPSFPLYEIEQVAIQMDTLAYDIAPVTFEAFTNNGRIAP